MSAFVAWYDAVDYRFGKRLHLIQESRNQLHFRFIEMPSLLSLVVQQRNNMSGTSSESDNSQTHCCISVYVTVNGVVLDCIAAFESSPKETNRGYECSLCQEIERDVYPSIDALWSAECFAPLQEWITTELARALAIELYTTKGGSTCASLVMQQVELNGRPKVRTTADGAFCELILLGAQ